MAWIPAAVAGGGALLGGLMGSGQEHIGWGDVFGENDQNMIDLSNILMGLPGRQYYGGQTYAPMHPGMQQALEGLIGFGQGQAQDIAGGMLGAGQFGLGALGTGADYLSGMVQRGAPQFQMDMDAFGTVMDNPYLDAMVSKAQRPIEEQFNYSALPGMNMAAEAGGNFSGSRAGLTEGLMRSQFGRDMSEAAAGIYNPAYNAAVLAGMEGGGANLEAQLGMDRNLLSGAQGLAGQGLTQFPNAFETMLGGFDAMSRGAGGLMDYDQLGITEDINRFEYNRDQPWADVMARIQGLPTLQGTAAANYQPGSSWLDRAMQGATFGGGLYDSGIFDFLSQPSGPAHTQPGFGWITQ